MITDVSTITIKGGYFEQDTSLDDLLKTNINIVYGRNGSGKSTITSAIAEKFKAADTGTDIPETPPQFEVTLDTSISEEDKKNVFVFNESFIENSVRLSKAGLKTIVMLGTQVEIEKEIQAKLIEKNKTEAQKKKLEEEIEKLDENSRESLTFGQFQAIHKKLSGASDWAARDSLIKGLRTNSKIQLKLLEELVTFKNDIQNLDISNEREALINDINKFQHAKNSATLNDSFHHVEFPICIKNVNSLLHKSVARPELNERDRKIINIISGTYNFLNETKEFISHQENDLCPFCFQELSESHKAELQATIEKHLRQEGEIYKKDIEAELSKIKDIQALIPSAAAKEIFSNFLEKVENARNKANEAMLKVKDILSARQKDIYSNNTPDIPCDAEKAYGAYNTLIDDLNSKINSFNEIVHNFEREKAKLIQRNKILAYAEYHDFIDNYFDLKNRYSKSCSDLNQVKNELKEQEKEIQELKAKQKDTSISLSIINDILSFIFFDKKRIQLEAADGCYSIKVNGKNIQPSKVSVGERNAIALSYFFASIGEDKTKANRYSTPSLIILDDPISSFDFENKVGILSVLRWQICEILKSCNISKFLIFSHDSETIFHLIKIADDITNKESGFSNKPKASFAQIKGKRLDYLFKSIRDKNNDRMKNWNAYRTLIETVFHFASLNREEEEDNVFPVGNSIRKMLEAYSTFVYSKGIDSMLHDAHILAKIPESERDLFQHCMSRLILNTDSHMMENARTLSATENHFSFAERQNIAKTALKFLFHINEQHLAAYLEDTDVETIKGWSLL